MTYDDIIIWYHQKSLYTRVHVYACVSLYKEVADNNRDLSSIRRKNGSLPKIRYAFIGSFADFQNILSTLFDTCWFCGVRSFCEATGPPHPAHTPSSPDYVSIMARDEMCLGFIIWYSLGFVRNARNKKDCTVVYSYLYQRWTKASSRRPAFWQSPPPPRRRHQHR